MIFKALQTGWNKLKGALKRAREALMRPLFSLLGRELDESTLEQIEQLLYEADFGVELTHELVQALREDARRHGQSAPNARLQLIREKIVKSCILDTDLSTLWQPPIKSEPHVLFVAGINGSGKTTSIAKLAQYYKKQGHRVLLAAADTFRAAAVDQLNEWAQRVGVDIVKGRQGSDPSSVVYDALSAASARGATLVLVDTAGRLHNKEQLMQELAKMTKVASKVVGSAPHGFLLVLDAVTGQNALQQAKAFSEVAKVSGVMLTKVDGAAKGGMALALQRQYRLPIAFLGTGETAEDMELFNLQRFVEEMFDSESSLS